ncbi:lytic transglycosylase domain-containing protein [Enterobacter ludwigii]|jgi:soluble lytic murein transglycosylase-like protein
MIIIRTFLLLIILFPAITSASSCLSNAATRWNVPEIILEAIISQESSWQANARNSNKNGSNDYGLMQINSVNVDTLMKVGIINHEQMLMQPCPNIHAGAWLLSQKFKKYGYSWRAVGAYHSETPHLRDKYANAIIKIVNNAPDFSQQKSSVFRSGSSS